MIKKKKHQNSISAMFALNRNWNSICPLSFGGKLNDDIKNIQSFAWHLLASIIHFHHSLWSLLHLEAIPKVSHLGGPCIARQCNYSVCAATIIGTDWIAYRLKEEHRKLLSRLWQHHLIWNRCGICLPVHLNAWFKKWDSTAIKCPTKPDLNAFPCQMI